MVQGRTALLPSSTTTVLDTMPGTSAIVKVTMMILNNFEKNIFFPLRIFLTYPNLFTKIFFAFLYKLELEFYELNFFLNVPVLYLTSLTHTHTHTPTFHIRPMVLTNNLCWLAGLISPSKVYFGLNHIYLRRRGGLQWGGANSEGSPWERWGRSWPLTNVLQYSQSRHHKGND